MKKIAVCCLLIISIICSNLFFGCNGCSKTKGITSYEINCTLNGNELNGSQIINFYNHTENPITELKFNLFANAFRKDAIYKPISQEYYSKAYKHGESFGEITILSCSQKQTALEFDITGKDSNILKVKLLKEVFPQESVSVTINYKIILANVVARTGINENTINLANFYPILCGLDENGFYECLYYANGDPYFSDCANYKVTITADKNYVVASSGKIESSTENQTTFTKTYKIDNARSFAFVLSKNFETAKLTACDTEITYYYYNDKTPQKSIECAKQSIELFTKKFGKYPYPTYSVVQTEFIQGGMEFPALVMISDSLEPTAYREVIVHETAHQWWQTVVGNNEIEYGFLDEGLAEYSVVLFYENYPQYSLTRQQIISSCEKTYRIFCSVQDKLLGKVNTAMLRNLGEFSSEYEYVNLAYVKPCIMYEYLRKTIGEERFFKGLSTYYKLYSFKNAIPDDLVGAFEKTGADTNGFFDSFFSGRAII